MASRPLVLTCNIPVCRPSLVGTPTASASFSTRRPREDVMSLSHVDTHSSAAHPIESVAKAVGSATGATLLSAALLLIPASSACATVFISAQNMQSFSLAAFPFPGKSYEQLDSEARSSPLIQELLKRSEQNKERNRQEIQNKYCLRGAEWGVGDCALLDVPAEERKTFIDTLRSVIESSQSESSLSERTADSPEDEVAVEKEEVEVPEVTVEEEVEEDVASESLEIEEVKGEDVASESL